jgi:hypothetical protein
MKHNLQRCWHWVKMWTVFGVCVPVVFTFCLGLSLWRVSWWTAKEICGKWVEDVEVAG